MNYPLYISNINNVIAGAINRSLPKRVQIDLHRRGKTVITGGPGHGNGWSAPPYHAVNTTRPGGQHLWTMRSDPRERTFGSPVPRGQHHQTRWSARVERAVRPTVPRSQTIGNVRSHTLERPFRYHVLRYIDQPKERL